VVPTVGAFSFNGGVDVADSGIQEPVRDIADPDAFLHNVGICVFLRLGSGHAGFGFGLTTLALFLGSAPLYALPDGYTASLPLMAVLTLFAAFLLFFSLKEKVPAAKAAEALSEYIPTYEEEIT